eukprot:MONOS_14537.1-p1 / transcript=MONOS_14537.1 / gene=MONOS_14537 / organism=Monocercomonoides_exilis_PA203 / gene_product=unspecified product / transcript_product=unspecified product / location=Mono_scaffold01020:4544-7029(-) / protein_length=674 / sequence_SO=supercontig / SO=protein_coding / is_pseudo=false
MSRRPLPKANSRNIIVETGQRNAAPDSLIVADPELVQSIFSNAEPAVVARPSVQKDDQKQNVIPPVSSKRSAQEKHSYAKIHASRKKPATPSTPPRATGSVQFSSPRYSPSSTEGAVEETPFVVIHQDQYSQSNSSPRLPPLDEQATTTQQISEQQVILPSQFIQQPQFTAQSHSILDLTTVTEVENENAFEFESEEGNMQSFGEEGEGELDQFEKEFNKDLYEEDGILSQRDEDQEEDDGLNDKKETFEDYADAIRASKSNQNVKNTSAEKGFTSSSSPTSDQKVATASPSSTTHSPSNTSISSHPASPTSSIASSPSSSPSKPSYTPYTLSDFLSLPSPPARRGGLGADIENEEVKRKREEKEKAMAYAEKVKKRNMEALRLKAREKEKEKLAGGKSGSLSSTPSAVRKSPEEEKEEAIKKKAEASKRKKMLEFASKIPKPKIAPKPSGTRAASTSSSSSSAVTRASSSSSSSSSLSSRSSVSRSSSSSRIPSKSPRVSATAAPSSASANSLPFSGAEDFIGDDDEELRRLEEKVALLSVRHSKDVETAEDVIEKINLHEEKYGADSGIKPSAGRMSAGKINVQNKKSGWKMPEIVMPSSDCANDSELKKPNRMGDRKELGSKSSSSKARSFQMPSSGQGKEEMMFMKEMTEDDIIKNAKVAELYAKMMEG